MTIALIIAAYLASVCLAYYAGRRYYTVHRDEDPSMADFIFVILPALNVFYAYVLIDAAPVEPSPIWRKLFRL